jgi:hypothetical protein
MIRKLRMGMVGGGRDALIGGVHRMAARLDGVGTHRLNESLGDPTRAQESPSQDGRLVGRCNSGCG